MKVGNPIYVDVPKGKSLEERQRSLHPDPKWASKLYDAAQSTIDRFSHDERVAYDYDYIREKVIEQYEKSMADISKFKNIDINELEHTLIFSNEAQNSKIAKYSMEYIHTNLLASLDFAEVTDAVSYQVQSDPAITYPNVTKSLNFKFKDKLADQPDMTQPSDKTDIAGHFGNIMRSAGEVARAYITDEPCKDLTTRNAMRDITDDASRIFEKMIRNIARKNRDVSLDTIKAQAQEYAAEHPNPTEEELSNYIASRKFQ